jgi:formate dehydrogenase subunit gamma
MILVELLNKYFRELSMAGMAAVVLAIIGHRILFGVHYPGLNKDEKDIKRFSLWERFIHLITMLSFLTLAVTGFVAVIWYGTALSGWLRFTHIASAVVFAVGFITITLRWAEDCRFAACDWQWAKGFGGYLGGHGEVPAGRFNGGQKGFFWAILCLGVLCILSGVLRMFPVILPQYQQVTYLVHRYSSLLLVLTVLAHIYLGTFANPGTWQVLLTGKVSARWAYLHHLLWQYKAGDGVVESGREKRIS